MRLKCSLIPLMFRIYVHFLERKKLLPFSVWHYYVFWGGFFFLSIFWEFVQRVRGWAGGEGCGTFLFWTRYLQCCLFTKFLQCLMRDFSFAGETSRQSTPKDKAMNPHLSISGDKRSLGVKMIATACRWCFLKHYMLNALPTFPCKRPFKPPHNYMSWLLRRIMTRASFILDTYQQWTAWLHSLQKRNYSLNIFVDLHQCQLHN